MADPATHVPFRGGGFAPKPRRAAAWITLTAVLAIWQGASSAGLITATTLPSPTAIAKALWNLAASGDLVRHLGASLSRLVLGWIGGTMTGLVVGFSIGMWGIARSVGDAMEIDGVVKVPKKLPIGEFAEVTVTGAEEYDLIAK